MFSKKEVKSTKPQRLVECYRHNGSGQWEEQRVVLGNSGRDRKINVLVIRVRCNSLSIPGPCCFEMDIGCLNWSIFLGNLTLG